MKPTYEELESKLEILKAENERLREKVISDSSAFYNVNEILKEIAKYTQRDQNKESIAMSVARIIIERDALLLSNATLREYQKSCISSLDGLRLELKEINSICQQLNSGKEVTGFRQENIDLTTLRNAESEKESHTESDTSESRKLDGSRPRNIGLELLCTKLSAMGKSASQVNAQDVSSSSPRDLSTDITMIIQSLMTFSGYALRVMDSSIESLNPPASGNGEEMK